MIFLQIVSDSVEELATARAYVKHNEIGHAVVRVMAGDEDQYFVMIVWGSYSILKDIPAVNLDVFSCFEVKIPSSSVILYPFGISHSDLQNLCNNVSDKLLNEAKGCMEKVVKGNELDDFLNSLL